MSTHRLMDCNRECRERQQAELDFVKSAYTEQEAWITSSHDACEIINTVHRRLDLQFDEESQHNGQSSVSIIAVELVITLPLMYPVDESSIAHVDVSVLDCATTGSTTDGSLRKLVMNSLPSLLQACRETCRDFAGQEAVFAILSRADEWLHEEWRDILLQDRKQKSTTMCSGTIRNDEDDVKIMQELVLARKLIYSHHIIAKSKRKAIADLSRDYQLGGYAKIGWPGIIIIEGEESNCNRFIDEIKVMRWQYLVVRGEEFEKIANGGIQQLDKMRRFPIKMEELADDQISHLANVCKEVGLESLFKSFMKIKEKQDRLAVDEAGDNRSYSYGALVHVDHMNHRKGYEKWIEKACKSIGCIHAIVRFCHANSSDFSRPFIFVLIIGGEESSVKQVIKKWRTSKVDVDSKGMPCLERMMSVVVEAEIKDLRDPREIVEDLKALPMAEHDIVFFKDAIEFFATIGGSIWRDAIFDHVS